MHKLLCILLCCGLLTIKATAQDSTATEQKAVKILPVPALGYSQETRFYVGGVVLFTLRPYQDTLTRTSNAKAEVNYTWNKQFIAEVEWNYFFKREAWYSQGKIRFSRFPDLYYGVGGETPASNELRYNTTRQELSISMLRNLGQRWFAGPDLRYVRYSNLDVEAPEPVFPELLPDRVIATGLTVQRDTRNSLLTPTSGLFFRASLARTFASSNYTELTLDLRRYLRFRDKYTLALRFYNDFNFGDPPFFEYAYLGGDRFVRGYYYGRYRDNHLSTLQAELRMPLVWRFRLAVFGGMSNNYHDGSSLAWQFTKPNVGAGLRFLVDKTENTYLRLDYAVGDGDNSTFTVAFGEAF